MTWCFLPDTASPSVQAAADLTWVLTLPSRALPPPALSSGKNTPDPSSALHSAPDTSPPPRSGTTSRPSTGGPGAASVIPCLPDTHASRFPQRDKERARTIHGTSGLTLPGSSERFNRNGSSLRTSPATSALALKPCCEPYGTWASRLRLAYSQRVKSARRMKGSGSSSWPTATPMQTREGWTEGELTAAREKAKAKAGNGNGFGLGLGAVAGMWTTPQAHDVTARGSGQVPSSKAGNACLATDAMQWQTPVADDAPERSKGKINSRGEPKLSGQAIIWGTPRASDAEKGGPNQAFGAGGIPLPAQAAQWPTPVAQNVKGSSEGSITRADGKSRMDILHYRAEQGFSRPAHLTAPPGPKLSQLRPIWRPLRASLIASHGRAVWRRLWTSREKARLNPIFVGWLMGFPKGHALCGSWEMLSFHFRQLTPGEACQQPMGLGRVILEKPNDYEDLSALWVDLRGRAPAEQVLRQEMPASGISDGKGLRADGCRTGTSRNDGAAHWPQVVAHGARSPQERGQAGQPHRELRGADCPRTHQPTSVEAPEVEGLRDLRDNVRTRPARPRAAEDLFEGVSLPARIHHDTREAFMMWQRDMRGALSLLPTASGAWIWKPSIERMKPVQRDLFAEMDA